MKTFKDILIIVLIIAAIIAAFYLFKPASPSVNYKAKYDSLRDQYENLRDLNALIVRKDSVLAKEAQREKAKSERLDSQRVKVEQAKEYWKRRALTMKPAEVDSFLTERYATQNRDSIRKRAVSEIIEKDYLDSLYAVAKQTIKSRDLIIEKLEDRLEQKEELIANLNKQLDIVNKENSLRAKEADALREELKHTRRQRNGAYVSLGLTFAGILIKAILE